MIKGYDNYLSKIIVFLLVLMNSMDSRDINLSNKVKVPRGQDKRNMASPNSVKSKDTKRLLSHSWISGVTLSIKNVNPRLWSEQQRLVKGR